MRKNIKHIYQYEICNYGLEVTPIGDQNCDGSDSEISMITKTSSARAKKRTAKKVMTTKDSEVSDKQVSVFQASTSNGPNTYLN